MSQPSTPNLLACPCVYPALKIQQCLSPEACSRWGHDTIDLLPITHASTSPSLPLTSNRLCFPAGPCKKKKNDEKKERKKDKVNNVAMTSWIDKNKQPGHGVRSISQFWNGAHAPLLGRAAGDCSIFDLWHGQSRRQACVGAWLVVTVERINRQLEVRSRGWQTCVAGCWRNSRSMSRCGSYFSSLVLISRGLVGVVLRRECVVLWFYCHLFIPVSWGPLRLTSATERCYTHYSLGQPMGRKFLLEAKPTTVLVSGNCAPRSLSPGQSQSRLFQIFEFT